MDPDSDGDSTPREGDNSSRSEGARGGSRGPQRTGGVLFGGNQDGEGSDQSQNDLAEDLGL